MQKKGRKGKDKDLIMQTYAKQHITSHHWISASGIVEQQERQQGWPMLALIVPILIILIVSVPMEMVIISNRLYRF